MYNNSINLVKIKAALTIDCISLLFHLEERPSLSAIIRDKSEKYIYVQPLKSRHSQLEVSATSLNTSNPEYCRVTQSIDLDPYQYH